MIVSLSIQKTLLIVLLSFFFIGQSLASSVMAYQMMNMNDMTMPASLMLAQENVQPMNDHCIEQMKSSISSEKTNEETNNNCCENQCNCFVNGCSAVTGITTSLNAEPIVLNSIKIHPLLSPLTSQQLTSLYRPPIFA